MHGRKSASTRFDGHKAAVVTDVESQVITAVGAAPCPVTGRAGGREGCLHARPAHLDRPEDGGDVLLAVVRELRLVPMAARDALTVVARVKVDQLLQKEAPTRCIAARTVSSVEARSKRPSGPTSSRRRTTTCSTACATSAVIAWRRAPLFLPHRRQMPVWR